MPNPQVLKTLDGLGFAESLRWRGEELWFSDMFRGTVIAWNPNGVATVKLSQADGGPEMPGGLGWTPDGELLVVDCLKRLVIKLDSNNALSVFADLSSLTEYPLNDMHVDADGSAWVGGYGFDPETESPIASALYRVSPTGEVSLTPKSFVFPNGCERQNGFLAVAETFADRISFIDDDARVVKTFDCEQGAGPDGLSFDADGNLYVAMAFTGEIQKFDSNGESQQLVKLQTQENQAGGPKGIFDCAVRASNSTIAFSSACLDEDYAKVNDTGSITIASLR
jgi:sugar lactone lactonase YvrE